MEFAKLAAQPDSPMPGRAAAASAVRDLLLWNQGDAFFCFSSEQAIPELLLPVCRTPGPFGDGFAACLTCNSTS